MEALKNKSVDVWRILLFANCGSELLVLKGPAGLCLPELRMPQGQRVAPHLCAEAKRVWNLDTVCLKPLPLTGTNRETNAPSYQLMELQKPEELARIAPTFVEMSTVQREYFADPRDYQAVRQAMGVRENSPERPFADFGAFQKIYAWVADQLRPLGRLPDGGFRQLQADGSFALVRFSTNRRAVWFKAVGRPNLRELAITQLLSERIPEYIPELLAVRPEWNAWLSVEAQGPGLFECSDPATWAHASESLARMQIVSLEHAQDLLDTGAHDVRLEALAAVLTPFFSVMEDVAQAQTKSTVPKLSAVEIASVRDGLSEALERLQAAGIPDALNHLDLNPSNVVFAAGKCTFLDWAEAAVGCPFFSFEYLQQNFHQSFPGHDSGQFRRAYLECWTSALGRRTPEHIWNFLPLTAIYSFAVSALDWRNPELHQFPELAAYLRSLLRRMHRESERIRTSRAA